MLITILIIAAIIAALGLLLLLIAGLFDNQELAEFGIPVFYLGSLGIVAVMAIATFSLLWPFLK